MADMHLKKCLTSVNQEATKMIYHLTHGRDNKCWQVKQLECSYIDGGGVKIGK